MFSKEIKKFVWLVLVFLFVFAAVTYVGNVLTIGEKIGNITCTLVEILVDVLLILGPIAILVWKIKKDVLKYKFVCLDKITDENVSQEKIEDFLHNLRENYAPDEIPANLKSALQHGAVIDKRKYIKDYIADCEKKSDAAGQEIAMWAALSVVVSPERMTDTLSMLFWNFRIISRVLKIYGVRPSGWSLIKLYGYVLFSSLLVGSIDEVIENFNTPEIKIPFVSHATQAVATIYACLKTVRLTQYYLMHGVDCDKKNALKDARSHAVKNVWGMLHDGSFKSKMSEVVDAGKNLMADSFKNVVENLSGSKNKEVEKDSSL